MDATPTPGPTGGRRIAGRVSAGLLMFRGGPSPSPPSPEHPSGSPDPGSPGFSGSASSSRLELFIVHPGGPFFVRRDDGVWTIPKGIVGPGEDLIAAAQREFEEETGLAPMGPYIPLGSVVQSNRKTVHAWAFAGDWEPGRLVRANTFEIEWPPGSGRIRTFPEADRGEFVAGPVAERKLIPAQRAFIGRLGAWLEGNRDQDYGRTPR